MIHMGGSFDTKFCAILIILFCAGCTIPINYYLKNLTPYEITIMCKPWSNKTNDLLTFTDDTLDSKYNSYEHFKKQKFPDLKNSYYVYTLPPYTTCYLGLGADYAYLRFKEIIIYRKDHVVGDTIHPYDVNRFIIKKEMINKVSLWYNVR